MSPPRTRNRNLPSPKGNGKVTGTDNIFGDIRPITPWNVTWEAKQGTQVTVSSGHPFQSHKGAMTDLGGPFYTTRSYMVPFKGNRTMSVATVSGGIDRVRNYQGPVLASSPQAVQFPPQINSSNATLDKLGATAVARCKPTNSVADAATFLGELVKEGLPHLPGSSTWKDRTSRARNAGEEYLNYQFGWLPVVDEVSNFAKGVAKANTVLAQYERDAGKVVRRRYNFPEQYESKEEYHNTGPAWYTPSDSTFLSGSYGNIVRRRETRRNQWFSGAFTYALPTGYDSRSALDRYALMAEQVFGASLTPETLWNLSPWSWAVDWFSNAGDVVSNISDWQTDGLVMVYGYIMEYSSVTDTYMLDKSGLRGYSGPVESLTVVTETKVRRPANPFGFGLSWDGLSTTQKAIAAAIGLTRL